MKYKKLILVLITSFIFASCGEDSIVVQAVPNTFTDTNTNTVTEMSTEVTTETEITETFIRRAELKKIDELDANLDEIFETYYINGLSVAVFVNGEVVYTKNRGYADRENKILANDNTKYRCASISKTVTSLCAMMLNENKLVDIDAPISDIVGLPLDSKSAVNKNTTRHLMTHTSSFCDSAAYNWASSTPFPSLERVLSYGSSFTGDEPGNRYLYSNFGAGLVSAVIECVTGERFYNYAENALFKPLGLDAGYMRTMISDTDNIANIYSGGSLAYNVKTWGRTEKIYDVIPLGQQYLLGQCELIISAPDLAKIGIILAGDGGYDGIQVISPETAEEMSKAYITADDSESYGIGVRINEKIVEGRTIYGHPGQALGMVGGLYFDRSDNTGVAILTNGAYLGVNVDNNMYTINDLIVKAVYEHID